MEEISSLKNSIWKHFKRTRENLGKCNYCSKVFNAPNLPNLKKHLLLHADIDLSATKYISVVHSDEDNEKNENSDAEEAENIQSVAETSQVRTRKSKYGKHKAWNYFEDRNHVNKTAKCTICSTTLSYKSTTGNLRAHLFKMHGIDVHNPEHQAIAPTLATENIDINYEDNEHSDAEEEENIQSVAENNQARTRKSKFGKHKAWNYFEDRNHVNKTAKCTICSTTLSYKSTTGNLRAHLFKMHGIDVHDPEHQALAPTLATENIDINLKFEDEDSADAATFIEDDVIIENPLEEGQVSSEVMQFFQETSSKSVYKCILCNKPVHNSNKKLLNHLSNDHPDLVVIDETGDGFDEPESPLIKEFLKIKSTQKKRKFSNKELDFSVPPATKIKIKEAKKELSEIDCFLQYIGVLLKDFSKENFSELQLEIIKLIMTKKIQCQRNDVSINQSSGDDDQSRAELLHPSSSTNQNQ